AALAVSPQSGAAPLPVTADASGSTDADAWPIATYTYDFGDGTTVGPVAGSTAVHTYQAQGTFTVTMTVTDTAGMSSTATATVSVSPAPPTNLVGNPGFETSTSGWNNNGRSGITVTRTLGGHSGSYAAVLANTTTSTAADCTLNDSPNWVGTTSAGTYVASLWVRADSAGATLRLRMREYASGTFSGQAIGTVVLSTSWQQVTVSYVPTVPGGSNIDLTAYTLSAPPGTCFWADDASITHT
ncbi:MAG: PKD domain-containing protein, partial [Actinomycetes bacterium]